MRIWRVMKLSRPLTNAPLMKTGRAMADMRRKMVEAACMFGPHVCRRATLGVLVEMGMAVRGRKCDGEDGWDEWRGIGMVTWVHGEWEAGRGHRIKDIKLYGLIGNGYGKGSHICMTPMHEDGWTRGASRKGLIQLGSKSKDGHDYRETHANQTSCIHWRDKWRNNKQPKSINQPIKFIPVEVSLQQKPMRL